MIEKLVQRGGARVVTPDAPDDDTPTSVLLKTLLDAFSQFERQIIKQRTKSAMAVARSKNQCVGRIQFGKHLAEDGRHLEDNPFEVMILDRIRWLRVRGYTLEDIATDLNQAGFANRQGRPWKASFVARPLTRLPSGDGITLRSA